MLFLTSAIFIINHLKVSRKNERKFYYFFISLLVIPSAGNHGIAEFTLALLNINLSQEIALSLNQEFSTVMAKGVASFMSGDITQIYISDSLFHGEIPELFQC